MARSTPAGSRTKGAAFKAFSEYLERELGQETNRANYHRLPAELRSWLEPDKPAWGIVVSTWYPSELLSSLLALTLDPLPEAERARLLREGTRYSAEQMFRGVYRTIFQLAMTPERCAKNIQLLWRSHNDTGDVTWTIESPGRMVTALRSWPGHDRYRCEINRLSEISLLEMLGQKGVESRRIACIDHGDDRCSSLVTWRPR
jgi:hypothetical protein